MEVVAKFKFTILGVIPKIKFHEFGGITSEIEYMFSIVAANCRAGIFLSVYHPKPVPVFFSHL